MNSKSQFSLAFLLFQMACVAVALASLRAFVLRAQMPLQPPFGPGGVVFAVIFTGSAGALIGGFFNKTARGGMIGVVCTPVMLLLAVLLKVLLDWPSIFYGQ